MLHFYCIRTSRWAADLSTSDIIRYTGSLSTDARDGDVFRYSLGAFWMVLTVPRLSSSPKSGGLGGSARNGVVSASLNKFGRSENGILFVEIPVVYVFRMV